jgi:hypothetical protein
MIDPTQSLVMAALGRKPGTPITLEPIQGNAIVQLLMNGNGDSGNMDVVRYFFRGLLSSKIPIRRHGVQS